MDANGWQWLRLCDGQQRQRSDQGIHSAIDAAQTLACQHTVGPGKTAVANNPEN
jgi:hypothetical protein